MTEKELKRLNRQELLEVLLAQSKKIDRLQKQLNEAKEKLAERELQISEAGSIAEASLVLNHIFADAQSAADQYLENIRRMHAQAEQELAAAKAAREHAESMACEDIEAAIPETKQVDGNVEFLVAEQLTEVAEEPAPSEETSEAVAEVTEPDRFEEQAKTELKESLEAAERSRKEAADYLEEARLLREQTERECAEKRRKTDKQIRVSLIRTKKAVRQMIILYADEVTRRMKRLQEWDKQMEALHERKIEKLSSKSQE